MEIKKTRTIPAKTEEYTDEVICDICGKGGGQLGAEAEINWGDERFDFKTTGVFSEKGESYPEGGWKETTAYHICPECWESKLIPWLASQGANPTKSKTQW